MAKVIDFTVKGERRPGPYARNRRCTRCRARLRTTNPRRICDPCWLKSLPPSERTAA